MTPSRRKPVEKTLKCPYPGCNKHYTCPFNVNQHVREQHTNTRPHVCHICVAGGVLKGFNRAFGLNRHMKNVHHIQVISTTGRKRTVMENNTTQGFAQDLTNHQAFQASTLPWTNVTTPDQQYSLDFEADYPMMPEQQEYQDPMDTLPKPDSIMQEEPTSCMFCDQPFFKYSELQTHLHTKHYLPLSPECPCPACVAMYPAHATTTSFDAESTVSETLCGSSPASPEAQEKYDFFDQFPEDQYPNSNCDSQFMTAEYIIDNPMLALNFNDTDANMENTIPQTSSATSENLEAGLQESAEMKINFDSFDFNGRDVNMENVSRPAPPAIFKHSETRLQESTDMELNVDTFDFDESTALFGGVYFDEILAFNSETFSMG